MTPTLDRALELFEEYAQHDAWRCEHPDRYPWEPDCPCGLTAAQRELGLPVDTMEQMRARRGF